MHSSSSSSHTNHIAMIADCSIPHGLHIDLFIYQSIRYLTVSGERIAFLAIGTATSNSIGYPKYSYSDLAITSCTVNQVPRTCLVKASCDLFL